MHEHNSFIDGLQALAAKVGPGIAGSVLALKGLPADASLSDRFTAVLGGSASAYYIAPGVAEWLGATGPNTVALIAFAVGAFGLVIVGEVTRAIREVGLTEVVRAWLTRKGGQ